MLTMGGGKGGLPPGTVSNEAVRNGKPALTVEAGGMGRIDERHVQYHVQGIINVMKHLNMIEGEAKLKQHKKIPNSYPINLKHGGIWHPKLAAGQLVSKGELLGEVTDPFGKVIERLESPAAGVIEFYMYPPTMNAGDTVVWLGEFEQELS